jgi:hypothetical protein
MNLFVARQAEEGRLELEWKRLYNTQQRKIHEEFPGKREARGTLLLQGRRAGPLNAEGK